MLTAILTTTIIAVALAYAGRDRGTLIVRRPYNNRYSDATGARDESFV